MCVKSETRQHCFGDYCLNHTIPGSNWEVHGFHKELWALHPGTGSIKCHEKKKVRLQRSSLPGSVWVFTADWAQQGQFEE